MYHPNSIIYQHLIKYNIADYLLDYIKLYIYIIYKIMEDNYK